MAYNIFGYPGPKGDSAYRVAVKNGFIGSEEDWKNSLKGSKGDAGPAGTVMVGSQQWSVSTKTGSDIQISTGVSTNTLYHGNFLTMAAMGGGGVFCVAADCGTVLREGVLFGGVSFGGGAGFGALQAAASAAVAGGGAGAAGPCVLGGGGGVRGGGERVSHLLV